MSTPYRMRLTLTAEEHDILKSALPLIGAKSVGEAVREAVREAVDAQVDAARSLLREAVKDPRVKNTH